MNVIFNHLDLFKIKYYAALLLILLASTVSASASETTTTPPQGGEKPYRILITNDDGIEGKGMRQLAIAVAEFADVVVVAPAKDESGSSQSSRLRGLRATLEEVKFADNVSAWAFNGTPSDCVAFGNIKFGQDKPFDMVLSGINYGANYGVAYFYSGTVGAAFQALADGVPAIAISQDHRRHEHDTAVAFTVEVVKSLLQDPLPVGEILSINIPNGELNGIKALPGIGKTFIVGTEDAVDADGAYYKPAITLNSDPQEGSDLQAYQQGYITLTPLKLDRNAYDSLENLEERSFMNE